MFKHKAKLSYSSWRGAGGQGAPRGPGSYVGNFGNLAHTFSDFDEDVLSRPELRERGDGPVLLLGPVEEVLVAMGKGLLLDLAEGEAPRLEVDLWALGHLEEEKALKVFEDKTELLLSQLCAKNSQRAFALLSVSYLCAWAGGPN